MCTNFNLSTCAQIWRNIIDYQLYSTIVIEKLSISLRPRRLKKHVILIHRDSLKNSDSRFTLKHPWEFMKIHGPYEALHLKGHKTSKSEFHCFTSNLTWWKKTWVNMWHTEYLLFSESHFTGNILSLHEFLEMLCAGAITGHNFGDSRGETQASHGYHRSQNICSSDSHPKHL